MKSASNPSPVRASCRWLALLALAPALLGSPASPAGPGGAAPAPTLPASAKSAPMIAGFGRTPLQLIPNRGQTDRAVDYYVMARDMNIFFAAGGLTFVLSRDEGKAGARPASRRWAIKLDFVGASRDVRPAALERSGTRVSYFKGTPRDWKIGLEACSKIIYRDLWPGIDLVYGAARDRIKYELIVHPGADASKIALAFRGTEKVELQAGGRLAIRTPVGGIEDEAPIAYQEIDGRRRPVPVSYDLDAATFGFALGAYDRDRTLVIDPSSLVYSGFIGGQGADTGAAIALGGDGSVYIVGATESPELSFPATAGPDASFNGGSEDVFVAKVRPDGSGLVYCGYIGGSGSDQATGVAVDASGCAYVSGTTDSTESTFPVLVGPDLTSNGSLDAFVAKVDPSGAALAYCGYIGGSNLDQGGGIALDALGNAYVAGTAGSDETTFPVKTGPDLVRGGFGSDAFVAKIDPSGVGLVYCGYIGGATDDLGHYIAVDPSGCAHITGVAYSNETEGFPVTVGPSLSFHGGYCDIFVAKVDPAGTSLLYCGYLGGSTMDIDAGIVLDPSGNAYIAGYRYEPPSGVTAFKVNEAGTAVVLTFTLDDYLGDDRAGGIALDTEGNVYVAGHTNSSSYPFFEFVGPGRMGKSGVDHTHDVFVVKWSPTSWWPAIYSGYIAGYGDDHAAGIVVDSAGSAYVVGSVMSGEWWKEFPVIGGPGLEYAGGSSDAFVSKLLPVPAVSNPILTSIDPPEILANEGPLTITLSGTDLVDGATVFWDGQQRRALHISDTELKCDAEPYAILTGQVSRIWIRNRDGQRSNELTLTVNSPVPRLDAISPAVIPGGGSVTSFRLLGAGFLRNSIVKWNGAALHAGWEGFVSMQALDMAIPSAYLATGGEYQVSIENPSPGGGVSGSLPFRITTFTLSCGASAATVDAGGSASYPILLSPSLGPFDAPVSFICDGLPRGCAATFSPANPTPGDAAVTVSLTVRTTGPSDLATASSLARPGLFPPFLALLAAIGALTLGPKRGFWTRRSKARRWLAACALLSLWFFNSSCGSGGSSVDRTPAGTYRITVRAVAGTLDVNTPLTLVVR